MRAIHSVKMITFTQNDHAPDTFKKYSGSRLMRSLIMLICGLCDQIDQVPNFS
jgi:hypothetical protein